MFFGTAGRQGEAGFSITMLPSAASLQGGLSRFSGDIRSMGKKGGPIDKAIREVIIPRIKNNFANQTSAGTPWKLPLSPHTPFMPYRQMYGVDRPPLDVRGIMKREATELRIWEMDGQSGTAWVPYSAFTKAPYAPMQQEGAPNNTTPMGASAPIPARPFIIINEADINRIDRIFSEWLSENFGKRMAGGATIGQVASSFEGDLLELD